MRAVIQRVTEASVSIENKIYSSINNGIVILLGIEETDTIEDAQWLSAKIARLRIFNDADGIMNLDICQVNGEALVVSQFTLHASTKKGNRPSYIKAAKPNIAIPLYEKFILLLEYELKKTIKTGMFGAMMKVHLINDGPVTIIIDTKQKE